MGAACRLWVVGHSQDVGTPAMAMSFRIMCPGDREAELGKLRHEKQQVLGRWGVGGWGGEASRGVWGHV